MRAAVKEVNKRVVEEGEEERVIGSSDFVGYYPNIPVRRTAELVGKMAETSEMDIKTDGVEMGLFLASMLSRYDDG